MTAPWNQISTRFPIAGAENPQAQKSQISKNVGKKRAPLEEITNKGRGKQTAAIKKPNKRQKTLGIQTTAQEFIPPKTEIIYKEPTKPDTIQTQHLPTLVKDESALFSPMNVDDLTKQSEQTIEQNNYLDIDTEDLQDPQFCTEYVQEIYENLLEAEKKLRPIDYMPYQKEVSQNMRSILVDWLIEVAEEYKLASQTIYLTVAYLDRYLAKKQVARKRLQLVGVTCLLLAAKYEEIFPPTADQLVFISNNSCKREEIFMMEHYVLQVLEFDLTVPSAKEFLRRALKAAKADPLLLMLSTFLCELTLQEYDFIIYLPSVVACASVCLGLHTLGRPAWSETLEYYTTYKIDNTDIKECCEKLLNVYQQCQSNQLTAVVEKFKQEKYLQVSDNTVVKCASDLPF